MLIKIMVKCKAINKMWGKPCYREARINGYCTVHYIVMQKLRNKNKNNTRNKLVIIK